MFSLYTAVVTYLGIHRVFLQHASGSVWINKDERYRDIQRPRQCDLQGKLEQEKKKEG